MRVIAISPRNHVILRANICRAALRLSMLEGWPIEHCFQRVRADIGKDDEDCERQNYYPCEQPAAAASFDYVGARYVLRVASIIGFVTA